MRNILKLLPTVLSGAGGVGYKTKILELFGDSIIQFLLLQETSGTNAVDESPESNVGTYANCTLANADAPTLIGGKAPLFNGTTSVVSLVTAGLIADLDVDEGAIMVWAKGANVGIWTDGLYHRLAIIRHNATGQGIGIFKINTNNTVRYFRQDGTALKNYDFTGVTGNTDWNLYALTWSRSNNRLRAYFNNSQIGSDVTGLAALTQTVDAGGVGGLPSATQYGWSGWESSYILLNREATLAEIQAVYTAGAG